MQSFVACVTESRTEDSARSIIYLCRAYMGNSTLLFLIIIFVTQAQQAVKVYNCLLLSYFGTRGTVHFDMETKMFGSLPYLLINSDATLSMAKLVHCINNILFLTILYYYA